MARASLASYSALICACLATFDQRSISRASSAADSSADKPSGSVPAPANRARTSADMRARFAGAGTDPLGLSAEESAALLAREIERWSKVAKQAQIKAE